jgi:lipopolysaccharide transport system ATP-binding protein
MSESVDEEMGNTNLLTNSSSHPLTNSQTHPLTNSSTHPPNKTPIIQVKHLSKRYQIGMDRTYKTFCESITDTIKSPLKRLKSFSRQEEVFWALKDINFEVFPGEVVGIIGRNGAGKTTLLKILSRITHPTEGEITLRGRVASLLEVGTGFHPELTGRENIYFNGAILGMTKQEIEDKFDEIVAFSGVKDFLDTPLKRYSSGMQVRLAFAVAAHLEPEILVVDEVLAVGDVAFQKKCLGKMKDVSESGRTVLFVSHNMDAVASLCARALLLNEGMIVKSGPTVDVIQSYLQQAQGTVSLKNHKGRMGEGNVSFTEISLLNSSGQPTDTVYYLDNLTLHITYRSRNGYVPRNVDVGIGIYRALGGRVAVVGTEITDKSFTELPTQGVIMCHIPRLQLAPGQYEFNIAINCYGRTEDYVLQAVILNILPRASDSGSSWPDHSRDAVVLPHHWEIVT